MTTELKPGSKSKSEWEFSLEYLPSIASAMLIVRRMLIRRTKNWRRMWEGILLVSAAELASCFSSRRKSQHQTAGLNDERSETESVGRAVRAVFPGFGASYLR